MLKPIFPAETIDTSRVEPKLDTQKKIWVRVNDICRSSHWQLLSVLTLVTAITGNGCKCDTQKDTKDQIEKHFIEENPKLEPPTQAEIEAAQTEIFNQLKKYFKQSVDVEIPDDVRLHLSRTVDDYIKAGSEYKQALGIHSYGFFAKKQIFLNFNQSAELVNLSKMLEDSNPDEITCATVNAVGALIHESAHAMTKDIREKKWQDFGNFTNSMHEALATETITLAPDFINNLFPNTEVPTNCCFMPTFINTNNQRYTIEKLSGPYADEVIFESYLFGLSDECPSAKSYEDTNWAKCSLKALVTKTFSQYGASYYLNEIKKRNRHCWSSKDYSMAINGALETADAPYLQYALSQCDGGEPIEDIACTQIMTTGLGYGKFSKPLILNAFFKDGKASGWSQTLEGIQEDNIYDLDNPLRFKERLNPSKQTQPTYESRFIHPIMPGQPCRIQFSQNFYCSDFKLEGFAPNADIHLLIRNGGSEYIKGKFKEGDSVDKPLIEGVDIFAENNGYHYKPAEIAVMGYGTCTVSPKDTN